MSLGLGFFNYQMISANGTFVYGGQGTRLFSIVINDPGSAWVLTVTDGPGGAGIATIRPSGHATLVYRATTISGIQVVASGTTAGNATILFS